MLGLTSWWSKAALIAVFLAGGAGVTVGSYYLKAPEVVVKKLEKTGPKSSLPNIPEEWKNKNGGNETCYLVGGEEDGVEVFLDCFNTTNSNGQLENQVEVVYKVNKK